MKLATVLCSTTLALAALVVSVQAERGSKLSSCRGPCMSSRECQEPLVCIVQNGVDTIPGCGEAVGIADEGYCIERPEASSLRSSRPPPPPDDIGIRYSKVTFYDAPPPNIDDILPLTAEDFPPNPQLTALLRDSRCISVVVDDDCGECNVPTPELIDAIGGPPIHVSNDPQSPFWEEFREVLRRQEQRIMGIDPSMVLPIPDIWRTPGLTLETVAEYVHDELPGSHHLQMIIRFIAEGFTVNRSMVPSPSRTEFLRREVMLSAMTTWAVRTVGAPNFGCKYHVGRARPEEVAWLISEGNLTESDGVPRDIVGDILKLNLESQFNFTAYPEGSPAHPSWPAMHSAGSASALWVPVVLNLNEEQICQTRLVDWAVSYARTVAGVHYISDNIAGLNLGQEIIARALPRHLNRLYGVDQGVVRQRIREVRFDWNTFTETDCYKTNLGRPLPIA